MRTTFFAGVDSSFGASPHFIHILDNHLLIILFASCHPSLCCSTRLGFAALCFCENNQFYQCNYK